MASQAPPSSSLPSSMGPGARPMTSTGSPGAILKELQDIRASYIVEADSDTLRLSYVYQGMSRNYTIPFTSMPISDGSRWLLYGGNSRRRVVGLFTLDMIRGAENMAGRPLTQTEAEGFAYHTGKKMRYNFLGTMVGFSGGYLYALRTAKTMKFPFRKPKPLELYDHFPTKRLAILQGSYSRLMWQITRANMYAAISFIVAQTLFGGMGQSVMTVGLYRDARTQEVVKSMKGNFDRHRVNMTRPGQAPAVEQQVQGHDRDPESPDFYDNQGRGTQDYSSGGGGSYSGDQTFSDSTTDTEALDDSTMRRKDRQREARAPQYSPAPQQTTQRGRNSDFFFDDASPTAGNDPDMSTARPYQSSGGSVWDRIRKGGTPQRTTSPQASPQPESESSTRQSSGWQRPQSTSSQGDSFSFSKSEEERYLAKEQAQKDFDAMLERERKEGGSEAYTSGSFAAESGAETPRQTGGSAWKGRRGNGL